MTRGSIPGRLLALAAAGALLAGCGGEARPRLRLVTTTSVENSGLLGRILPTFERESGVEVLVVAVATGRALEMGRRGDADVLLTHAPEMEKAFLDEGHATSRRTIWWNDFVIVGPPADPAGVRGMRDVAAALGQIREKGAKFASRGDRSGTHVKELSLWKDAGIEPAWPGYVETGRGQGDTLLYASEQGAYMLTDRGTLLSYGQKLDLDVLVEGDARLRNEYSVMPVDPEKHPGVDVEHAKRLAAWLDSPEARALVEGYRVKGQVLFHPVDAR